MILQVVANDSDKGQNSELEYALRFDNETQLLIDKKRQEENKTAITPDAPWFEIEPRSGEISLVAVDESLSRCQTEKRGKKELGRFGLIVSVSDKGEPRNTATACVQVRFTSSDPEQIDTVSSFSRSIIKCLKYPVTKALYSFNLIRPPSWTKYVRF